jgi:CheY-like chemotaxis protein
MVNSEPTVGPGPSPLQVLVVDDDELMLELYCYQFEAWNLPVNCTWRSSAVAALQDIDALRPDLLITDLSMPGLDGMEMLRQLEGQPQLAGMQIVVVSGVQPEFIEAQGGISPRINFLRKPVDFAWLRRHVAGLAKARAALNGPAPGSLNPV